MKDKFLRQILIANLVLGTFLLLVLLLVYFDVNKEKIYPNIYVEDVELSGLSKKEAMDKLKENMNFDKELSLYFNDKNYMVDLKEFGFSYDIEAMAQKAIKIGKEGNPFRNIGKFIWLKLGEKEKIPIEYKHNYKDLEKYVEKITSDQNKAPVSARLAYENGKVKLFSESYGQRVNIRKVIEDIKSLVESGFDERKIELSVDLKEPEITGEKIGKIDTLIAKYYTIYSLRDHGRACNVEIGAEKIDNMILMPMEEASFNSKIGEISLAQGYKYASIINNGEFVQGIGGGVCQISSTLYNALLEANIEIVERHRHSKRVNYVPYNRDATISPPYLDLKFKNNSAFPVYIRNYAKNGIMTSEIYSEAGYLKDKP